MRKILSLLTCSTLLAIACTEEIHKESNYEKNQDIMKTWVNDDEWYIRMAFAKLESTFKDSNDFVLHSFGVHKTDTLINNASDTIYKVRFTYSIKGNTKDTFLSRLNVFRNEASIVLLNVNASEDAAFQQQKRENQATIDTMFKELDENKKVINEAMKTYRDSIQNNQ